MPGRGKPFARGNRANPTGRPKGSRSRATVALETILDGDADAILRKATEMAKGGDPVALRLCLDRILPVRRDRPVVFELPPIESAADLPKATGAVLQAVTTGQITPSEAGDIGRMIDAHAKAVEVADLNERLKRLEAGSGSGQLRGVGRP